MNDQAKVIEALGNCVIFNYFEKLVNAKMRKLTLFSVFPYTAAANLSDPHYLIMVDDILSLTRLNSGRIDN
jgi:hypothetical protein